MTTVQVPVPEHAPPHPVKCVCKAGPSAAANTTDIPIGKSPLHEAVQLMPAGVLVTEPPEGPVIVSVRVLPAVGVQTRVTTPEGGGA
jgi:hypothetical protein